MDIRQAEVSIVLTTHTAATTVQPLGGGSVSSVCTNVVRVHKESWMPGAALVPEGLSRMTAHYSVTELHAS